MADAPKKTISEEAALQPSFNVKGIALLFRYAVMLFFFWTLVIGISLAWTIMNHFAHTREIAKKEVNIAFDRDVAIRVWAANHGGLYVPTSEQTPPNPYLAHIPERDITTPSGKKLTLMNPAYMLRQVMSATSQKKYGPRGHLTSLKPLNPINAPDDWERGALLKFERGEKEVFEFTEDNSGAYLRLMRPLLTHKPCLKCHEHQGYKEGDIRGGVGVKVDMAQYLQDRDQTVWINSIFHSGIWIFGVVGISLGVREAKRRIQERHRSDEILRKTQEQLLYAQKLAGIGEMAAGVSHEVLNPLNIISVHTQMLKRNTKNDASIQSFCNKVKLEIERINKIVNSLLEFSRMGKPVLGKINIKEEIEKTVALVEESYKLDNIEIVRDWCDNPAKTKCDPDKIRQVFANLLQNAKYAMPQGGTITMGCRVVKGPGDKSHQIYFSDTGAGMGKDVKSKIFEPFFTTKPVNEGTGMGLSVVHGIIEEHGGTISVESDEGKGTTFTISLPVA